MTICHSFVLSFFFLTATSKHPIRYYTDARIHATFLFLLHNLVQEAIVQTEKPVSRQNCTSIKYCLGTFYCLSLLKLHFHTCMSTHMRILILSKTSILCRSMEMLSRHGGGGLLQPHSVLFIKTEFFLAVGAWQNPKEVQPWHRSAHSSTV